MARVLGKPQTSLNPYESFRDINQDNDWYDADRWNVAAREGRLAMEADIIRRGDSELGAYADYVDKYHLDRATDDIFYAAVSKDLYADDTEIKDWEEEVLNPDTQKYETKKYQMTEKQWIEHQLQNWIDYDNYMIEQELKEEEKANRPWIVKFFTGFADVGGSFLKGALDTIEGAGRLFSSLIDATGSAVFQGKNWLDVFREDMSVPYEGSENLTRFEDEVLQLDDWSILRDANGNYTTIGNYISQVAYTLGQMAPSMVANAVLPGMGTLAGVSSKVVGRGSMAFYYTAMWSNRTTERFQDPNFASTPTWLIMLDSTIKTTTDILIEQGLRIFSTKLFGGTSTIDRLMYGTGVAGTAKGVARAASKLGTLGRVGTRLARDFVSEGMEEVLQDVAANISSQVEGLFYDSFNTDEITMQSVVDTFVVAGLASVLMSGVNIAFTPSITVDTDIEGNKASLGKLKSWLYYADYNNLVDTYETLLMNDKLTDEQRSKILTSMRNAATVTASLFRGLGEERVKNAFALFDKIKEHYELTQKKAQALNVLSGDARLAAYAESQQYTYKEYSIKYAEAVILSVDQLKNDYAKSKINKKSLFKRNKNKDGSTKRQTVAEKLVDADVTQVHDFIAKTDINDIQPQEGRSEKRVNLAKKIAKELDKDVAYTDGHNTVDAGDVQMIPGEYADTHEDMEVLRTITENEFIDTLVAKLPRPLLDRIRNWWRTVQQDKRKGTYEDAVRALLFDDNFFAACFATANQEMYQFITHIRDVLNAAKGNKVSDAIYQKVIEGVLERYKPIIRDFIINQQNADLSQLQDFFTDVELRDIVKNRWSFDLTNRILNQQQYNKLTDADKRIIENRINYLQADNTIKEQIRKDLQSRSVDARVRALRMLDNEYNNLFFSKYNDRIYFEPTSPARNYFNQFMQNLGINLLEIRTGRFSKKFLERIGKVLDTNGNPYTDPIVFIQEQFGQFTENGYAFEKNDNNIRVYPTGIIDNSPYTAGSMEYYNDLFGLMQMTMQDETGVLVEPSRDRETMRKFLNSIVDGSKINDVTLAFTSINDIVQRPQDYLKTEDLMNIREDYVDVNNYTTFQYLRDMLLDKYETITLVRYADGQVLFADMTSAYDALLPSIANMSKNTNSIFEKYVGKGPISITKFIDPARLSPELMDYTIEFVRDKSGNAGTHNPQTHTIVINNSKNNAFTRFAILHEFQHAIQNVNRLAGGLSPYFIVSDKLLKDFEKNLPQLFAENASVESKKESIRWFLYKTASGEIDANLFSDSIAFMGTLVRGTVGNKTHIITPWGTEHDIIVKEQGQALDLPDYDTGEVLTIIDPKKYPDFYKAMQNYITFSNDDIDENLTEQDIKRKEALLEIPEIRDYMDQMLGGKRISEDVRENLLKVAKQPVIHDEMLYLAYKQLVKNVSYEKFLNMDIPFVRVQNNKHIHESDTVSITIGEQAINTLFDHVAGDELTRYLYVGTIKPKDLIAYIPNSLYEGIISSKQMSNTELFQLEIDNEQGVQIRQTPTKLDAGTWYDDKVHIGGILPEIIKQHTDDITERWKELAKKHSNLYTYKPYKGDLLQEGEVIILLPNNQTFLSDSQDSKSSYVDVIQATTRFENTGNEIILYLGNFITTEQWQQILQIAKKEIQVNGSILVSIADDIDMDENYDYFNPESKAKYTLSDANKVSTDLMSMIKRHNSIVEANDVRNRPIDRLDEQPGQEQKHQPKAKQRSATSKRGAKPRANSDRTYVSKAASKGTNLAAFAGRRIAFDMQGFIMEASPTRLPGELWEKIENGTLNYYDVHYYFRTHHDIDNYTFQLIRKYFFPNSWFKTNEQLRKFTDLDLAFYYALQGVLYEAGFDLDVTKPMKFEDFMKLYEQISQNPSFKDRLDKKAAHFMEIKTFDKKTNTYKYEALDIDQNHLRVAAMELMDGSIDSAAHIIALARAIALSYRYGEAWNTADLNKKNKSLQDITKGHKADTEDSGTLEDIIEDVRTSQDMMTQSLEERIATSTYAQKLELLFEYYGDKLRKKNPDYRNWSEQKQRKAAQAIKNKIDSLTPEQFDNMYRKILAKQMGVNFTEKAIENDNVAKPVDKRKNIVASIKRFATTIKNYRSADQWKRVPDEYKQYFDEDGNLKQEVYARVELKPDANGNYPKLQEIQSKLGTLAQGLRRGDFRTQTSTTAFKQAQKYKEMYKKQKETNQKLKNRYALVSDNKNLIIQSNSREFKATAGIAMPDVLRKIFDTEFEHTRQSKVKFIADPNDKRAIFNQKYFFEVNADTLTNLTKDDVEEIIRFFDSAILLEANQESLDKFRVFKIYLLAYFIDEARSGRWDIDSYYLERADDILNTVSTSAREMAAWRSVLYKVNPNKVIIQALARRLDVEIDEMDVKNLTEATKTGDVRKILKAQRELARNTLYRYKTVGDTETTNRRAVDRVTKKLIDQTGVNINDIISNPEQYFNQAQLKTIREEYGNTKTDVLHFVQDFVMNNTNEIAVIMKDGKAIFVDFTANKSTIMNKILTFQKAAMLSGPATAIRNQISNIAIEQGNKAAEVFGKAFAKPVEKVDSWIRKLIKRPHGELAVEQIDIIGVKVTDDVKEFIQKQIIETGVFEFISEGASKYDTRKSRTYSGMDALTDMVVNNIVNEITRGNTYNSDVMNSIIQTIFSWQSDNRYINRTAKRYLGKLLTAQNVDLSKGLSEEVMTHIAEAYKLAAFDYMHKTNVISELENKLRERAPKVYAGYKMIFPFIPTSWNWFVESINWSPVGLVKNIVQLCRLEKTVDKLLLDRQRGRQTYDPRLAKYVITRNVGKGVMGSLLMGLGMLLGGLGVFQVDDDDDKLKIKIGDVYFNINNIFGASSIILGAELMNPRQGSISEVLEAAFGAITEDAWLNDIANMFSYGADSVWDVLLDKPTDILGTFVPNFLKSLNKLFYTHEVKYDSGFLGNLEYLAASSIPFLAYAFPKKIDPFTGEVQSKYGLPFIWDFLVDLINVASPMQVKPHVVSEQERVAIELGLNKQPLTGKYDDIGQVDYTTLNMKYGSLNQADLIKLLNNQVKYTVEEEDGKRRDKYWRQMTEEQKKTVVERIMSNNSRYAKIYTWTQAGHKYYASNSEYITLKKLGITKNIFKGDKGFVA